MEIGDGRRVRPGLMSFRWCAMILRFSVARGRLDVIAGEGPAEFVRVCRELAAEYSDGSGTIVLRAVRGEAPTADFHGDFSSAFQQRLRNLWALAARAQRLPDRRGVPLPIFQIAVGDSEARPVLGNPPEVITKFCEAFARANPAAVVRVTGMLEDDVVNLHVMGEMPELVQGRLLRRWAEHQRMTSSVEHRPNLTKVSRSERPVGRVRGTIGVWGAVILAGFLAVGLKGRTREAASHPASGSLEALAPVGLAERLV